MSFPSHEDVVGAFNVLGYGASFAAVAERLGNGVTAADLYDLYPSHDALAEAWLSAQIPTLGASATVRGAFAQLMAALNDEMTRQRDFAHAWLAAALHPAPPDLLAWKQLHGSVHDYFHDVLTALNGSIALPPPLVVADVVDDLADVLAGAVAALLVAWRADRSPHKGEWQTKVDAAACIVDALLVRRADFLGTSLLVHLHSMTAMVRGQFLEPLTNLLLSPGRVQRLGNAPALADLLRTLLPPHTPVIPAPPPGPV